MVAQDVYPGGHTTKNTSNSFNERCREDCTLDGGVVENGAGA